MRFGSSVKDEEEKEEGEEIVVAVEEVAGRIHHRTFHFYGFPISGPTDRNFRAVLHREEIDAL